MPRLTKEEQLVKDLKDNIFLRGKLVASTMPVLNKRLQDAINDPKTELSHLINIYKLVNIEADKLVADKSRQDKEARDIKTEKLKQDKLRTDKKIADEKLKTMVKERLDRENSKEVEEALAASSPVDLDDEESISQFFSTSPADSPVQ